MRPSAWEPPITFIPHICHLQNGVQMTKLLVWKITVLNQEIQCNQLSSEQSHRIFRWCRSAVNERQEMWRRRPRKQGKMFTNQEKDYRGTRKLQGSSFWGTAFCKLHLLCMISPQCVLEGYKICSYFLGKSTSQMWKQKVSFPPPTIPRYWSPSPLALGRVPRLPVQLQFPPCSANCLQWLSQTSPHLLLFSPFNMEARIWFT